MHADPHAAAALRDERGRRAGPHRVLLVVRHPVGGIRTFLRYVFGRFDPASFELALLAPDLPETAVLLDDLRAVCREYLPVPAKVGAARFAAAIVAATARSRFDLIHSHGFTSAACSAIAAAASGTAHVVSCHDVFVGEPFAGAAGALRRTVLTHALSKAARIHCVGFDARDNLLEHLPRLREAAHVVLPNGIETRRFLDAQARDLRSEFGLPADAFLVGFLGRFMPQKGFDDLLDALSLLRSRRLPKPVLVLAFGEEEGFIREERARVARMGLSDHVRFLPFVADVAATLKGLDVVAMPSRWEACGLLAIETMVAGVPLIGSECVGLREVLQRTPARRIPPGNARALADAIAAEMREPTQDSARRYSGEAARRFDAKHQAQAIERMLLDVLDERADRSHARRRPGTIALLNDHLHGGGTERVLAHLSGLLARDEPLFVFDESDPWFVFRGERVGLDVAAPPYPTAFAEMRALLLAIVRLRRQKRRYRVGTCISQKEGPNLVNVLSGVSRTIVTVHEHKSTGIRYRGVRRRVASRVLRAVYNRADLVVTVSRAIADDLARNFGIDEQRLRVVYNPCDADGIATASRAPLEPAYEPLFDGPTLVSVGRLVTQKGQWHLIRALVRIRETIPDARLLLIGTGENLAYLERLAQDSGLAGCVHFLGYRSDPFPFLRRADVFVLSSLWEGFPACLQEALACGVAIVSTDCPAGPRELLEPGADPRLPCEAVRFARYGVLTPPLDGGYKSADDALAPAESALADAVVALLRDPPTRLRYAADGPARAREFGVARYLEQWRALLDAAPEAALRVAGATQPSTGGGNA